MKTYITKRKLNEETASELLEFLELEEKRKLIINGNGGDLELLISLSRCGNYDNLIAVTGAALNSAHALLFMWMLSNNQAVIEDDCIFIFHKPIYNTVLQNKEEYERQEIEEQMYNKFALDLFLKTNPTEYEIEQYHEGRDIIITGKELRSRIYD